MELYICDIRNLSDLKGINKLDKERRSRLYRYRRNEDRMRCLCAGLMLLHVLGVENAAAITASDTEKPVIDVGPWFNLSHSGNYVILAVDGSEVGADIEQVETYPKKVAEKVFMPSEQKWLLKQGNDEAFYRLWTGKEAVMKALGLGFRLPPESFEINPDSQEACCVCGRSWYLDWNHIDNHVICTASESPEKPDRIIMLTGKELLDVC